jgi:hypothetical protein
VQATQGGRRTTKAPGNPATISYNSDQIPTTTPDIPKEPVPFGVKCGKKKYDEYDVSNALTAGCFYWKKGTKIANTEVRGTSWFGLEGRPTSAFDIRPSCKSMGGQSRVVKFEVLSLSTLQLWWLNHLCANICGSTFHANPCASL